MAHLSKIFTQQKVDIPNRSGYDMSFENLLTMKCGTLVPVLCEFVSPNETFNIGHLSQVTLPPMATNFFGRIDMRLEAFFVPMRTLWGGWQNFFTMPFNNPFSSPVVRPTRLPHITTTDCSNAIFGRGTLTDYLGVKVNMTACPSGGYYIPNLLPYLAYHKIYDDWYRNKQIQQRCFVNTNSINTPGTPIVNSVGTLPWFSGEFQYNYNPSSEPDITSVGSLQLSDGVSMFALRQRNWAKDYFTTAALYPQASGDVLGSTVEFDTSGETGEISISALRQANVLQRWMERNNVCGEEYADQIKGHFGVMPSDAVVNRAIFLGSDMFGVYNRSVYQTTSLNPDQSEPGTGRNPFISSVGSTGASSQGFKDGNLVNGFKSSEHGYLIILASIVPHAYYSTGVRRHMTYNTRGDIPIPLLQGLGEQPIYDCELTGMLGTDFKNAIFGYQQQYSEVKYHDDEVHGLLVDGSDLESFALQRSFPTSNAPDLSTSFLQIPESYLDQVQSVSTSKSGFSAWLDMYFNYKKVSPFSEWVMPTLGDLKDTHKENIPYRGRML